MRITRGNHLTAVWQHMKVLIMLLLAATASLGLYRALSPVVAAEQDETAVMDSSELQPAPEPPQLQLIDGEPQPTSMQQLRRDNATLTWTPTGTGQDQDTYDVRVGTSGETDPVTKELKTAPWFASGLSDARFDMTPHPAGTYYWQVKSCDQLLLCGEWSEVWTMTIDDVVPLNPTAEVTSDMYDTTLSLAGTGEAGTTIVIAVGTITVEAVVAADGTWTATFDQPFDFGTYEAVVKSVDVALNESPVTLLSFGVKELFVAPQITVDELPVALAIVPVDETHENLVFKQPTTSVIDVANTGDEREDNEAAAISMPLSTEGGIVQSSQDGWRLLGVPWFLWAGIGGMLSASWLVSSGRLSRSSIGV